MTTALCSRTGTAPCLTYRNDSSYLADYLADGTSIHLVSTELTRRRAVDLLRVSTALCRTS